MDRLAGSRILLVFVVIVMPAWLRGGDRGTNRIEKITVEEEAEETVIRVSALEVPTFTVFKLTDPVRLFVDVSSGDTSAVADPIIVDNGVVEQIGTLQFKSGGISVGRVIIGLREETPYEVMGDGKDIVIRVDGRGRRPMSGEKSALAGEVEAIRARLERERRLLAEIEAMRAREEALRQREEETRREAERLRLEAQALKDKSEAEARQAREVAQSEEARLEALRRSAEEIERQHKALEAARLQEAERLALLQREREIAAREREALAAAAAAEREKAEAMRVAAEKAIERRRAEEEAARKAEANRKATEAALAAEQERLRAVRMAREAEDAHRASLAAMASEEEKRLEHARLAREREERLLAQLKEARAREVESERRARETKDAAFAADLAASRERLARLEAAYQAERARAEAEAQKYEEAHRRAVAEAREREEHLAKARARLAALEESVRALQAERDQAGREAEAARAELARVQGLAEKAAAIVAEKDAALKETAALRERLAGERQAAQKELAALERRAEEHKGEVERLERELARMRERREEEAARLKDVQAQRADAESTYQATIQRLAEEERRLAALERERAGVEESLRTLRAEVEALAAGRVAIETEEARRLRERLEAREAEILALKNEVAAARSLAAGQASKREAELEARIQAGEQAVATMREQYEAMLAQARSEGQRKDETIRALGERIEQARGEVEAARKALAEREAEVARLRESLRAVEQGGGAEVANLKRALARAQAKTEEVRQDLAHRIAQADELVRQRTAEVERLKAQIERLKADRAGEESRAVAEMRARLQAREAEIGALRRAYESARGKARASKEAKVRADRLREALAEKESEIVRLRKEYEGRLAEQKARLAERDRQIEALEAQVRMLKDGEAAKESVRGRQVADLQAQVAAAGAGEEKVAREREVGRLRGGGKNSPVSAKGPQPVSVTAVDFKESGGAPSVVLAVSGLAEPIVERAGERSYVLTLEGATIPPNLARRMDVSAFESPVRMVTAFQDANGAVRVIADLSEPVGQQVRVTGDRIEWRFSGPAPEQMVAAAAPTPSTRPGTMLAQTSHVGAAPPPTPEMAPPEGSQDSPYKRPSLVPKKKKYKGRRVNLTVKDADIQNVLTFLAREGRVNIVTSEDVQGKVTFHLEDVPWDLALDIILKAKGLDYVVEQGIYRVAPITAIQQEFEARVKKQEKVRELKPVLVRLIPVNYGDANEMATRVSTVLSPRGSVVVDTRTNTLIVKDTEDYLTAVEELVRRLDQQTPQVLIEARIVEARTTFKEDIGIQWGGRFAMASVYGNETGLVFPSSIGVAGGADDARAPTSGIAIETPNFAVNLPAAVGAGAGGAIGIQLGSIGGAANLSLRLSAAEEEGDVKIISSPRISTLDNRKATIAQGVSIPISVVSAAGVNTQFFSADLRLDVTPHVTRDGHIAMKIDITKNEPDFGNRSADGNPTIQRKEAHTELLIRDGDTTVIGGIYTRSTGRSYKKVPLLGDIPILGWLFKSRARNDDRSELLIFITPKVVNREVAL